MSIQAIQQYSCLRRAEGRSSGPRTTAPIVFVVDDDILVRNALEQLIERAGWKPVSFACADEFLAYPRADVPSCLVLDVGGSDLAGLDVQRRIAADREHLPIIVITHHCDIPMTVRAMKAGAIEFLTKPLLDDVVVAALRSAIELSEVQLDEELQLSSLRAAHESLSARERQVMAAVVSGMLNKQIGGELGISEITVKRHRGNAMRKMNARSLAELVKMDAKLQPTRR
jgi:FixJ family two-component response regulator